MSPTLEDRVADDVAALGIEDDSDLLAEEEVESPELEEEILLTYQGLSSRRVDLVGDFAGNELFLIEADSLLLHCFSDPQLDFKGNGFQLLHAVYLVENYLHNLERRKCNFHIAFFDTHKKLCIPYKVAQDDAAKYLLARTAIFRHLQSHMQNSNERLRTFDSIDCDEFKQYLNQTGMYFVMCHDGAHHKRGIISNFRHMIITFIGRGYNVALVNGLEWRDTKVMTMVLEKTRRGAQLPDNLPIPKGRRPTKKSKRSITVDQDVLSKVASQGNRTQREVLAITTVVALLKQTHKLPPELVVSFLLHIVLLKHLPLSGRRLEEVPSGALTKALLCRYAIAAESVLSSKEWSRSVLETSSICDVHDLVDGRLFSATAAGVGDLSQDVKQDLASLCEAVAKSLDTKMSLNAYKISHETGSYPHAVALVDARNAMSVMPFSNAVFDKHLASIHLTIDDSAENNESDTSARIFRELSHWHNAKRPIAPKAAPTAVTAKEEFWALRRNQWFMAEMQTYAASLTNSVGKSLEPETVVVGAVRAPLSAPSSGTVSPDVSSSEGGKQTKGKEVKKKPGKVVGKNAGKAAIMAEIAAANAKKVEASTSKLVDAWHLTSKDITAEKDLSARHQKLKDYLGGLNEEKTKVLAAEVQLYMLNTLLEHWIRLCQTDRKDLAFAALIWHSARSVLASPGLTKTICTCVELAISTLKLPPLSPGMTSLDRALPFKFALPSTFAKLSLDVGLPPLDFQLLHCGPYLDRSNDSAPDSRVDFEPDGWQRRVLDGIDADKSLFVVAPTSAGKTFISFYAMRKVLEADEQSVLVYVAPTKALVNQIAAEIQARYSKKFKHGGKSVWAIHTRDYRINNPTGCQVLVTVPHVLQIMLLAPSNANSWSSRVKRIIFDEVHSIGNADDGVVWEQLLLLSPCPIIALSATIGNPAEFSEWLSNTQAAIGNEVLTEGTTQRYSDLRKFNYVPAKKFQFEMIGDKTAFGTLGLDGVPGFAFVHPVASLVNKTRGIPEDFSLEPRDCFTLFNAMLKHQTSVFPVPKNLVATKALPASLVKKDTITWQNGLKSLLASWMADDNSPFDAVLAELTRSFHEQPPREIQYSGASAAATTQTATSNKSSDESTELVAENLLQTTLPLLCSLHEQDALPAICFNYDRGQCERICEAVVEQLTEAETTWKNTNPKWKAKVKAWEEWKRVKDKMAAKKDKGAKASSKKGSKEDREDADDEKASKLDRSRDAGAEVSEFDSFDPDLPVPGFGFAEQKKLLSSDLEIFVRQLRKRGVSELFINALRRGVGVHHAGMNRKYRQVCEVLFRKGYLRVVIATGTLALGINMPCKTVVFSGDSVFLTALNFRQGAGRAGRRGFDLLGNVVFQGIPDGKICRLLSSRLPDLSGHFPVTTTLVLRLFTLLHESQNSKYATKAINSLLSQPRLYMGGPAFKDQTLHHLRFSIEYLRRQRLLDARGAPLNFAGLISHLYYTENSSMAFHSLLKEGYFHRLCANIETQEINTLETLMLVMSHLFGRVYCRQADEEYKETVVKPSSSMVFLPPLPQDAAAVLRQHAESTLQVFKTYVSTFVDQHVQQPDDALPLTNVKAGASMKVGEPVNTKEDYKDVADVADEWDADDNDDASSSSDILLNATLPATKIRSHFVSLSGHGDAFASISDLCRTARSGVFLEESVIPHVGSYPEELDSPLNAYLLDFFKHGDVKTLERANRVRKGDVWFLLNDFSMVLATIITSMMNFMKLKPSSDLDMLEVMGGLDSFEEAQDDKLAVSEIDSTTSVVVADPAMQPQKPTVLKNKGKKLDSWEDESSDEDEKESQRAASRQETIADSGYGSEAAWEGAGGEQGLMKVLKSFQKLQKEFNDKFRAMWA